MNRNALIAFAVLAGCTTAAPDVDDPQRGPLGKADSVGSCADSGCEGQALDGSCFCDTECAYYGDCCSDVAEICEAAAPKVCGGFPAFQCDAGEYCDYEADAMCGFADQTGVCRPQPEVCTQAFAPVCGCNGESFANSCEAAQAGVSVSRDGACDAPGQVGDGQCGGHLGLACGDGQFCHYQVDELCGAADHLGTCTTRPDACAQVFAPVCGCDGQTYGNECQAQMAGTSIVHQGECDAAN